MRRKRLSLVVLGALSTAGLTITGCASQESNAPYALTGSNDQQIEVRQQARFTDGKGHYRPDWRYGSNSDQHGRF